MSSYLIIIAGPTAVGKTAFSVSLAEKYNTHIVSADSRQMYREFRIATSPPSPEILERVPHHFIHSHTVQNPVSAGDYEREALEVLNELFDRKEVVLLVGGSGFYIRALCEGLNDFPEVTSEAEQRIDKKYEENGLSYLQNYLKNRDPEYHAEVDLYNPHRLLRAVKVIESSGNSFTSYLEDKTQQRKFEPVYIALNRPRDILYERINLRVDEMIEEGLIEEAREMFALRSNRAVQTVGYKELFRYFEDEWTVETAIAKIKRNTRRYAKRQLTWYRNDDKYTFFHPDENEAIYHYIEHNIL